MASALDTIITLYDDMLVSRYMLSAGVTIMAYDWLLSLPKEYRYIWRSKWTPVKFIFLINRYGIPLTLAFAVYGWSGAAKFLTHYSCTVWVSLDSSIHLAFFATLHWVVAMRAWALWSRSLPMGLVIWGGYMLYLAGTGFLLAKAMIAMDIAPVPFVNVCFGTIPGFLWSIWLPSMVFETMVFVLTAIKAVHHNRQRVETPILTILYRDGFLYFIFICLNSFANLLVWAVAPTGMVLLVKYFTMAICQVAGSHLIIDLIEIGHISGATSRSKTSALTHQLPTGNTTWGTPTPHHHISKSKNYSHGGKKSLKVKRSGRGEDAYEMMPSPSTPELRDMYGIGERSMGLGTGEWKAPAAWSFNDPDELDFAVGGAGVDLEDDEPEDPRRSNSDPVNARPPRTRPRPQPSRTPTYPQPTRPPPPQQRPSISSRTPSHSYLSPMHTPSPTHTQSQRSVQWVDHVSRGGTEYKISPGMAF